MRAVKRGPMVYHPREGGGDGVLSQLFGGWFSSAPDPAHVTLESPNFFEAPPVVQLDAVIAENDRRSNVLANINDPASRREYIRQFSVDGWLGDIARHDADNNVGLGSMESVERRAYAETANVVARSLREGGGDVCDPHVAEAFKGMSEELGRQGIQVTSQPGIGGPSPYASSRTMAAAIEFVQAHGSGEGELDAFKAELAKENLKDAKYPMYGVIEPGNVPLIDATFKVAAAVVESNKKGGQGR